MKKLKNVLLLNSLSSGLTGLLLIFDARYIAELFNASSPNPFIATGIFLLVFAVTVFLTFKSNIPQNYTPVIVAADGIWVLASAGLVAFRLAHYSDLGYILISAVAFWVAAMAVLQYLALTNLSPNK